MANRSVPGTSLVVISETATGLIIEATIDSGTPPTTTGIYALGAQIRDLSTGLVYTNRGTTALPVFPAGATTTMVNLSAADLIAMYTTPVAIVAPVAGKAIIVDSMEIVVTRTSTAFTGGGTFGVQYAATANGAGTLTTANIAATVLTGAAGTTYTARIPVVLSDVASASIAGIGLYISNTTAAFAAGTGTAYVRVAYHLV